MATQEQILQAVYTAIDEVNEQLPSGGQIPRSPDAILFGQAGALDSLGLVSLIVAVEQSVENELGATVTLADEKALSQRNSPFRSVATLTEYIGQLLAESNNG
jgi:acyl carrier protein